MRAGDQKLRFDLVWPYLGPYHLGPYLSLISGPIERIHVMSQTWRLFETSAAFI